MESLKNSRRQEREEVGSWLQLYLAFQNSQDALCSPYGEFLMAYVLAVLTRRFGSRADLRELASIDYPDETASWSTVVDKYGYLLSAQGRRAHEAAKAEEAAARKAKAAAKAKATAEAAEAVAKTAGIAAVVATAEAMQRAKEAAEAAAAVTAAKKAAEGEEEAS